MMAGSSSSPRLAMKILLGVSAKTPACDPHVYPFGAIGFGKPATTLYGPVSSSPPFSWAPFSWAKTGVENKPHATMAASTNVGVRIAHLLLKKICGTDRHRRRAYHRAQQRLERPGEKDRTSRRRACGILLARATRCQSAIGKSSAA